MTCPRRGARLVATFRAKWPDVPVIITSCFEVTPEHVSERVVHLQKPWPKGQLVNMIAHLLQPTFPVCLAD